MPISQRVTETQANYLEAIWRRPAHLRQGEGGYASTRTVRVLSEKGLVRLWYVPRHNGPGRAWEAALTERGRQWVLARQQREQGKLEAELLEAEQQRDPADNGFVPAPKAH
jgi:hypothetical protein